MHPFKKLNVTSTQMSITVSPFGNKMKVQTVQWKQIHKCEGDTMIL